MELSEAYNTIDATLGMFRYFEEQVTDGMLKQDFLLTPLISCVEPVLDLENNTSELKRLEYYTYVECDTEYKVFIVDIRPVCSFMINEWPSHKAQRIYKLLRSVFFQCIDISRNIYKENEIELNYPLDEGYHFNRYNTGLHDDRTIEDAIFDSLHEMSHALGLIDIELDEQNTETDEDIDNQNEDHLDEVDVEKKSPKIFKNQIKENEVVEAVEKLTSQKVVGKRRWYVIYRVLRYIEWLSLTDQTDFIAWVKCHFVWDGVEEFRGVQSEFIHHEPNLWDNLIIKGKNGKPDNYELGPTYYEFAIKVRDTFVNVDSETGEMKDLIQFRNNAYQGVYHNTKWK